MMDDQSREKVLQEMASRLASIKLSHPLRVGIDGVSSSGKTVLADELSMTLHRMGLPVIRSGIDGFHNPPEIRHRRGAMSVDGYVEDSFDYEAVRKCVLEPLGPEGKLNYLPEIYDHARSTGKPCDWLLASPDSILLFEGVMLFREEIKSAFDYKILVDTSFDIALKRAKTRDLKHFGNMQTLLDKYTRRFIPGQKRYLAECLPAEQANAIFGNDDPYRPKIKFNR